MSKPIYTTADEAEAAFYDALARGDLDAMMAVWSEDDDVVCVHPDAPRIVGLAAVRESWRQLFASGARLIVRHSQPVPCANMMLAVHNVIEHITIEGEERLPPPIVATNVYTRGAHGWRMVMHHASPAPDTSSASAQDAPRVVH